MEESYKYKVAMLREYAREYNLLGVEILDRHTLDELCRIYNGCGPECWSSGVREYLDDVASMYLPCVLIHDCQFGESDGKRETFDEYASMFRSNCLKVFHLNYPLKTWRILNPFYIVRRSKQAGIMGALCVSVSGEVAYGVYKRESKGNVTRNS